jgi:hypothetical protein
MVQPCVARNFFDLAVGDPASMFPASDWSFRVPGQHGYQRARGLISGRSDLNGPFGSPVFAYAGKTDPPSRFIFSQTSAGKGLVARFLGSSLDDVVV